MVLVIPVEAIVILIQLTHIILAHRMIVQIFDKFIQYLESVARVPTILTQMLTTQNVLSIPVTTSLRFF
jgi:hypothetical protein